MTFHFISEAINREERILQLSLLGVEVGKRLKMKRLTAEEEAGRDRANALKAYVDDGDEEAPARAPTISVDLTLPKEVLKISEDKSRRAVINDVDCKAFVVF